MEPADSDAVAAQTDGDVAGTVELPDGTSLPVALDANLVDQARQEGVDIDRLRDAAVSADVDIKAQTDGDQASTIPVQSRRETDLTSRLRRDRRHQFIQDDQIQRLIRQGVNYTERIGHFLLSNDDLIPTVKERLKALIVGEDGITPEPADPDSDADQRLAEHLEQRYEDDIRPTEVIDAILRENMMNARAVLRATDLRELDLADLDYLRDGVTGEEIYVQDRTTVYEFDLDEQDTGDDDAIQGIDLETRTFEPRPLVIGEHVFDISLYDRPPLEAIATTAVNKMVLQRLKARKAEITSFGAVYATVEPPSYLPEDQYFDRVPDDDWDGDGQPPTKLERALSNNLQNAFDTIKDFQSGTTMAVPDFWTLEQLDVPETDDPIDDQIRGYNRDISRRLLVPLDLIELQSGSELSRETMFQTLMTTIAGWRREIKRVFDAFADTEADIEGIAGDVDHTFPPLQDANTKQVISALQYAGVAGLSQREVRQMMNTVQGIDLETEDGMGDDGPQDGSLPPDGGPDDPDDRTQQMRQMLDGQRRGDDVDLSIPDAVQNAAQQALDARDDDDVTVNGMTDRGWRRAEQLADGGELDAGDILSGSDAMAPWWARHFEETIDTSGDQATLKGADADNPWADNSYTAGKGWGGVAGARFAFRKAAALTDGDDADDWRDWVDQVQAGQAPPPVDAGGGSGNGQRAGDAGATVSPATAQDGDGGPTDRVADILDAVPFLPNPGDGPIRVTEDALKAWLAWVRADRPALEADFNPSLHPRGPDGQFISRPYDVPDDVLSDINDLDTPTVMDRLVREGELSSGDLDAILQDDAVSIDGVPDDASTRQDLLDQAGDGATDTDAPEAMEDAGWVTPDAPDLRLESAEDTRPLVSEGDAHPGSASQNMEIADFEGGRTAFIKRFRDDLDGPRSDGEKPTLAERERAADAFLRNLGFEDHLPAQFHDQDDGYMASEKVDGDNLRGSPPSGDVDEERFKDFAAATILAGNSDLHGDNWRVQDDGSFAAIDLNKSGGDFTSPSKFRSRGAAMIMNVSAKQGIDWDRDDLAERAGELAQDIDPDQALDGVPNSDISDADRHQFRDNIEANIEAFAAGDVSL